MAPDCCYSVMLFLLYLVIFIHQLLLPADSKCQEPFKCGHQNIITSLEFPLSPRSYPECGIFPVYCESDLPHIKFSGVGSFLEVHHKISENKFRVTDAYLDKWLNHNQTLCFHFLSPPYTSNFPLASFEILPNISLALCRKNLSIETKHEYFRDCRNYTGCDEFDLFYRDPPHVFPTQESKLPTPECHLVHMPVKPTPNQGTEDLLHLLPPEFVVGWNVSPECASCHHRGGMCLIDTNNQFRCKESEHKRTRIIILVSAISASPVFLGLCFVASFLIYRFKKKTNGTYLLSKDISSDPLSKSDLELGGGFYFGIPIFSYQELEEATDNFDLSNELGDGGFGTVYYGKLHDGREVAIKRLYEHNCRRVEQFLNEIKILTGLRHPNLVSLYGCTSRRSRELLLVYEYIPNGTVADHLHGEIAPTSPLTWPIRMKIAIETADALAYLHSSDIIHRDVKTNNILLDKHFCVKVADFGISRLFPNDVSHISTAPQGTPGYVDPEYHQCYQLTNKSDVYSFGVVLIELISSMPAVDLTRHRHEINLANLALDRIQRCAFDELIDSSLGYQSDPEVARMTTSVAEFAFQCLQLEKDLRPSMDEVLAFLKDIQAGEDWSLENTEGGGEKYSMRETDDAVLLKGNMGSSPVAVTESWTSISSATTSSIT